MNKEGGTQAPIRHPIDFNHSDFFDEKKLDEEMRRVFDICHGCRRCFNLCDSFPKLFDMIDESKNEDIFISKLPTAPKGKKINEVEVTVSVANNNHIQKK